MAKKQASVKTTSITLRKGTEALTLLGTVRPDGSVLVTVTTRDKVTQATARGMSETLPTIDKAKARITALAVDAQKLGWQRAKFGDYTARPDAFSTLPAPKA